jgi:D-alanyl-D-alanine dipeptidase
MNDSLRESPIPWEANAPTALDYHHVPVDFDDARSKEPLVDLVELGIAGYGYYAREDGFNAPYYRAFRSASHRVLCRRSIGERLLTVNQRLSEHGVELFVLNGYRSLAVQQELWAFFMERARTVLDNPTEADCVAFAGTYSSDPRKFDESDSRTWPTHITGGALDTTLRSRETRELLHMGGIFDDPAEISHTAYFENELNKRRGDARMLTLSDNEALRNRRLLYWAMTDAGFANYAYEWWHFDWGTQLWVVNSRTPTDSSAQPHCAWYGPAPGAPES